MNPGGWTDEPAFHDCAWDAAAGVAVVNGDDGHAFVDFVGRDEEAVQCQGGFRE